MCYEMMSKKSISLRQVQLDQGKEVRQERRRKTRKKKRDKKEEERQERRRKTRKKKKDKKEEGFCLNQAALALRNLIFCLAFHSI